jgi:hypothetical protein
MLWVIGLNHGIGLEFEDLGEIEFPLKQLKGMIHEVGRRILIEKTGVNISHDTVPLITNGEIFCVW